MTQVSRCRQKQKQNKRQQQEQKTKKQKTKQKQTKTKTKQNKKRISKFSVDSEVAFVSYELCTLDWVMHAWLSYTVA